MLISLALGQSSKSAECFRVIRRWPDKEVGPRAGSLQKTQRRAHSTRHTVAGICLTAIISGRLEKDFQANKEPPHPLSMSESPPQSLQSCRESAVVSGKGSVEVCLFWEKKVSAGMSTDVQDYAFYLDFASVWCHPGKILLISRSKKRLKIKCASNP